LKNGRICNESVAESNVVFSRKINLICNLISNLGISFCLILRNSIALLFNLLIWKCFKICNVKN
jgi:hypothetical protein